MSGISDLLAIIAKYQTAGKQVILKDEIVAICQAFLDPIPRDTLPSLVYVDVATVRVEATADSPAALMLSGFPNIMDPMCSYMTTGLSDGGFRVNVANVSMNMATPAHLWGNEKNSQWYCILATAAAADTTFALKAMPYIMVKGQVGQTISFGKNTDPTTGIGYGWTTDSLADYVIYVLSGDSKGLVRTITANNNDNATGGELTYGGAALTLAQGDVLVILPSAALAVPVNFRRVGDVYNNAAGSIENPTTFGDFLFGRRTYSWSADGTYDWFCPLTWASLSGAVATGIGSGAGGAAEKGGSAGQRTFRQAISPVPGKYYLVTIPAGGTAGNPGSSTILGTLLTLTGGTINWSTGLTIADETGTLARISGPGQDGLFGPGGRSRMTAGGDTGAGLDGDGYGSGGSGGVGMDGGIGSDGMLILEKNS